MIIDGKRLGGGRQRHVRLHDVQSHGIAGGVVQHAGQKIELSNPVQRLGKVVEQLTLVAMRDNGLGNRQQSLILLAGGQFPLAAQPVAHSKCPSIKKPPNRKGGRPGLRTIVGSAGSRGEGAWSLMPVICGRSGAEVAWALYNATVTGTIAEVSDKTAA